ncbi:developmental pluripotency-associated protein 3 [Urocitellus parryii]|uniref:developmental pluripotency-associated protein 3 n=1 Tax=Urocitellus parryii TaxID=9999 RepID=UPI000E55E6DB|nr:developmental pluripotency-associated protein 3 [Urocitellus parryii]
MDPLQKFNPTSTQESFPMSENEENSVDSHPVSSEMLVKKLHDLTLNPWAKCPSPLPEGPPQPLDRSERVLWEVRKGFPNRQRGVRTLLSARKDRVERWRYFLSLQKQERDNNLKEVQSKTRSVPFKCTCSFCIYHGWDPSENARIGYD